MCIYKKVTQVIPKHNRGEYCCTGYVEPWEVLK